MDKAAKLKQDGNELFKEKLYGDALLRYKVWPKGPEPSKGKEESGHFHPRPDQSISITLVVATLLDGALFCCAVLCWWWWWWCIEGWQDTEEGPRRRFIS